MNIKAIFIFSLLISSCFAGVADAAVEAISLGNQKRRERSDLENKARAAALLTPQTRAIEVVSEVAEYAGHAAKDRYEHNLRQNMEYMKDYREAAWDAAMRATEPYP